MTKPAHVDATPIEFMLNSYLRSHAVKGSGDEFGNDLWRLHMPRAAVSVPAIWHASNAIAAVQWSEVAGPDAQMTATKLYNESLAQYSASIKEVMRLTHLEQLSPETKGTILAANILFALWSRRHGNLDSFHAVQAQSMLLVRRWKFWQLIGVDSLPVPAVEILRFITKTERAVRESQLDNSMQPQSDWYAALLGMQQRPFSSTGEACVEIEMLWNSSQAILDGLPMRPTKTALDAAHSRRFGLGLCLRTWKMRLGNFEAQKARSLSGIELAQIQILEMRFILIQVGLKVKIESNMGYWDETCWDRFEKDFCRVVKIAESILTTKKYMTHFTPSVWKSLQYVAKTCRQSKIRHQAIDLLESTIPIAIDGVLRGCGTMPPQVPISEKHASIIRHIVNIEERGFNICRSGCTPERFICNMHRVVRVRVKRERSKSLDVVLQTVGDILHQQPGQTVKAKNAMWS